MNAIRWSAALCVLMALTACDRKTESSAPPASSVPSAVPAASSAGAERSVAGGLDVGGVKTVQVTASGQGATSAEAIDEAIRQIVEADDTKVKYVNDLLGQAELDEF